MYIEKPHIEIDGKKIAAVVSMPEEDNKDKIVMLVRPSMKFDLERILNIENGNLIYSMWGGYLQKSETKKFIDFIEDKGFNVHNIHSSGHADIKSLQNMVKAIEPKTIVPIHTFYGHRYHNYFNSSVLELHDGEELSVQNKK